MATALSPSARTALVRRGQWLSALTLGYNSLEGLLAIGAGVLAGSVALVGFGVDSAIELGASVAALWRLQADLHPARRAAAERVTLRVVGALFLLLAAYVAWDAGRALWRREAPDESAIGIAVAVASLVVMPLLARAKRRVATALGSCAPRRSRRSSAPTCPPSSSAGSC